MSEVPTIEYIRERLKTLSSREMILLSLQENVSHGLLTGIRYGRLNNPTIDSARKILGGVARIEAEKAEKM